MTNDGETWISAWEAVKLLKLVTGGEYSAQRTICERAHDKLISARAFRLVIEDHSFRPVRRAVLNDTEVPPEFWWARGHEALKQNWSTGDFETWIGEEKQYRAYGVTFLRSSIMSMVPSSALERAADAQAKTQAKKGEKIFIGHGRSDAWRELKDLIVERLKLPYDEFNAEPVAGVTNVERLRKMLDDAAFAFLVLTAEDVGADGGM